MSVSFSTFPQLNNYYSIQNAAKTASQASSQSTSAMNAKESVNGCQTCQQRRYQDQSNDPGVSFKSPGYIDPGSSAAVVMSHEQEHVSREQNQASQEGRRVVSQSVTLRYSVCPECHKTYVSGGETRTVTASDNSRNNKGSQNLLDVKV